MSNTETEYEYTINFIHERAKYNELKQIAIHSIQTLKDEGEIVLLHQIVKELNSTFESIYLAQEDLIDDMLEKINSSS